MAGVWMTTWWLWWSIFMLAFLVVPLSYGGYRGWGVPFPSYIQRRRGQRAAAVTSSPLFNHQSWGWGGDIVWIATIVGVLWAVSAMGWLR